MQDLEDFVFALILIIIFGGVFVLAFIGDLKEEEKCKEKNGIYLRLKRDSLCVTHKDLEKLRGDE